MKLFDLMLIPCSLTIGFYRKLKKKMMIGTILDGAKLIFILAFGVFFLLGYFSPFAQTGSSMNFPDRIKDLVSSTKPARDSSVQEILNLANMIRLITDDQVPENKVL